MVVAVPAPTKVPHEPVTRMRPSEALRIGRIAHPNNTNYWHHGSDEFCAVGLINLIRGDIIASFISVDLDGLTLKSDGQFEFPCHCWLKNTKSTLGRVTAHLSDKHSFPYKNDGKADKFFNRLFGREVWTQSQIADWLESVGA